MWNWGEALKAFPKGIFSRRVDPWRLPPASHWRQVCPRGDLRIRLGKSTRVVARFPVNPRARLRSPRPAIGKRFWGQQGDFRRAGRTGNQQERQRSLPFEAASPADRAVNADPIVHRLWAGVVFGCGGPGFVFLAPECTH